MLKKIFSKSHHHLSRGFCAMHGLWIGITPELLLKSKVNSFQTIVLAGTLMGLT
ncbi:hypothetical protein [Bacteroidetes bacterium endosymbiont of Geopemphigus sp.]|uniref:hypothetical protein n=1 Tax=Bacteroidetes bacterium endosymbiont of Geopemphigus sp. TaxID=2047937 RepID=UPI0018A831CB|nr:hypothetical protein [Bacteroidetes bacterium endosymbiont of Geopemphigus sp.]